MKEKLFPYKDLFPKISPEVFLAEGVKIIGDVEINSNSSVWYNTVIRGDVNYIRIGKMTNIQDNSVLHVTGKHPLIIGDMVTIGHAAKVHGCEIENCSLIGIGSIILDGAMVENNSIVAAGAVVSPGFVVKSGKVAAGVPARILRDLNEMEIEEIKNLAKRYVEYSKTAVKSINYVFTNKSL